MPDSPLSALIVGFNRLLGFRVVEWRPDFARVEMDVAEHHLNRSGIVHGGVLTTLMDAAGGYAGIHPLLDGTRRRSVTLSMTSSYIGQAKSGTLACIAERRGGGKTTFVASTEVRDEHGNLLAIGEGTYRYIAETPR